MSDTKKLPAKRPTKRDEATQQYVSPYPKDIKDQRYCPDCQQFKYRDEYYAEKRSADGLKRRCKPCHAKASYASRVKTKTT